MIDELLPGISSAALHKREFVCMRVCVLRHAVFLLAFAP